MPRIYLMQHAEAHSEDVDPERRITERGKEETRRVAEALKRAGVSVSTIFHSTKTRARQTAEIVGEVLGAEVREEKDLEPNADPSVWEERLRNTQENVMIVGHLPHLSKLLARLTGAEKEVVRFRYSGVVCLEKEGDEFRIVWFVTPDII